MFGTSPHSSITRLEQLIRVDITVVHAQACHFCSDAEASLNELAARFPGRLCVRVIELESPEGARLVSTHRPAMNPLVLVDGNFFSAGRLPRRKLVALLERAVAPTSTAS